MSLVISVLAGFVLGCAVTLVCVALVVWLAGRMRDGAQ